jgi:hypothetical protein
MPDKVSLLIDVLKETEVLKSNSEFVGLLSRIQQFPGTQNEKIYLLGHFFKFQFDADNLEQQDKEWLVTFVKEGNHGSLFYMKSKPPNEQNSWFAWVMIAIGTVALPVGVLQLIENQSSYGISRKYLLPVIREGGSLVILGLGAIIGAVFSLRYEKRKKKDFSAILADTRKFPNK